MPIIGFGGGFGGGGTSYINGVVATSADLPTTVGDPPLDSVYLSKAGSGVWLINRKPAGLYCRTANNGNAADWTYLGAFPEVNADGNWELYNSTDPTKELKFNLSAIATGTTRTLTVPDGSGTIQLSLVRSSSSMSSNVSLSAGRARHITYTLLGGSYQVTLPLTGNQSGDVCRFTNSTSSSSGAILTVVRGNGSGGTVIITTLEKNQTVTCFNRDGTETGWTLEGVDSHTHAASEITSGVFDNARINFAAPSAIGSTTAAAITGTTGTFSTLSANSGTITASAPVLDLEQTWNNAAVAFTGMRLNCVQTANSTSSSYFTISRTGTPVFQIVAQSPNIPLIEIGAGGFITRMRGRTSAGVGINFDGAVGVGGSLQFGVGATTGAGDLHLNRDAADTLALQRGTAAQTFRLYNTYTDASNYERAKIAWSSNVLQIGTEKGGTGSARALEFQTDGVTRLTITTGGSITNANSTGVIGWSGSVILRPDSTGVLTLFNSTQTDFGRLQFGGTTSSFPALKRSSTALQVRLADDSADAPFSSGAITTSGHFSPSATNSFDIGTSSVRFRWGYFFTGIALGATSTGISSGSDGVIQLRNNNGADFGRLQFGGTTSSFPALKRSTTTIQVRLADDSGDAGLSCSTLTLSDNLTFGSGDNIVLSTTTGTQIGTATTQLLGFYGATPVVQQSSTGTNATGFTANGPANTVHADSTFTGNVGTIAYSISDIVKHLKTLGLIAS